MQFYSSGSISKIALNSSGILSILTYYGLISYWFLPISLMAFIFISRSFIQISLSIFFGILLASKIPFSLEVFFLYILS